MGWAINHYFTQLAEVTHYVNDEFNSKRYTKSMRFKMITDKMTAHISIGGALMAQLGAKPHLYDYLDFVPPKDMIGYYNRPRVLMQTAIRKWVRENPYLFGFTDKFYYIPHILRKDFTYKNWDISSDVHDWDPENISKVYDIRFKMREGIVADQEYTWDDIVWKIKTGRDWRTIFHDADEKEKVVLFNIKVPMDSRRLTLADKDINRMNHPILYDQNKLFISKLVSDFRLFDEVYYHDGDPYMYQTRQQFATTYHYPLLPRSEYNIQDLIFEIVVWKENTLRLFDTFEFTSIY